MLENNKTTSLKKRIQLFEEYLEQRQARLKVNDEIFDIVICLMALSSILIVCTAAKLGGVKGAVNGLMYVFSPWWIYFLYADVLLNIKFPRKCLAFFMASINLSKEDFNLFRSNLSRSSFIDKNRPLWFLGIACGIILLRTEEKSSVIILLLSIILIGAVYFSLVYIGPFLIEYRHKKICICSTKKLLTLVAWQEIGGLLFAVIGLAIFKFICLTTIYFNKELIITDLQGGYSFLLFVSVIYFLGKSIPVFISLILPALILETMQSAIFYITFPIILIMLSLGGVTVIPVFMIAFFVIVLWNIFIYFPKNLFQIYSLTQAIKHISFVVLCVVCTSLMMWILDVIFEKLGITFVRGVQFYILLLFSVWADYLSFGLIISGIESNKTNCGEQWILCPEKIPLEKKIDSIIEPLKNLSEKMTLEVAEVHIEKFLKEITIDNINDMNIKKSYENWLIKRWRPFISKLENKYELWLYTIIGDDNILSKERIGFVILDTKNHKIIGEVVFYSNDLIDKVLLSGKDSCRFFDDCCKLNHDQLYRTYPI